MADFISLTELKSYIGVTDASEDIILGWMAIAAQEAIISYLNTDPRMIEVTEYLNGNFANRLSPNRTPISLVSSINIDGCAINPTDFYWDDHLVYLRWRYFPKGYRNVQVVYTAGFDQLPTPIKLATLMTAKAMWSGRLADQNATGESFAGVMSQQFWGTGPGSIPPQAANLLNPYRKVFKG